MGPDAEAQILNFVRPQAAPSAPPPRQSTRSRAGRASADLLDEVDQIFDQRFQSLHELADSQSRADANRIRAQEAFSVVCSEEIRPAMQAFLDRIRKKGGSGLVEERAGDEAVGIAPRITLWMSLSGEIVGRPRPDRHPFLQLDVDASQEQVHVTEGDMWQGRGTSGRVGSWNWVEITSTTVTEALLSVLRKAAT